MKDKVTKWFVIGVVISIVAMVIGYVLWTNLTPIQGMDTMTALEIAQAQRDLAINAPLGTFLMNSGFIAFGICLTGFLVRRIMLARLKRK